jgi:protein-tyrosine phosphatase
MICKSSFPDTIGSFFSVFSDTFMARKLIFLCTGNYYRSRFAELYFRHIARTRDIDWQVDSRGLRPGAWNVGPLSVHTRDECDRLGISCEPLRDPQELQLEDLQSADRVIAVKETEHRPLMLEKFPDFVDLVEYWEIHDLDVASPPDTFLALIQHVDRLIDRLAVLEQKS